MDSTPCAHCGELVPDDATRCRHCGSDFETGWNSNVEYHSIELPDPPGTDTVMESHFETPEQTARNRRIALTILMIILVVGVLSPARGLRVLSSALMGCIFFGWVIYILFFDRVPPRR